MTDIFLSYSHEDVDRIKPLVSAFETQGWSVFWDRHIPAGKTWRNYIGEELDTAKCVIVAWSNSSIASKWVTEEADVAQKRDALIPVFLDVVEIPFGFRSIQAADLSDWEPEQGSKNFDELVNEIGKILNVKELTTIKPAEPELGSGVIDKKPVETQVKAPRYGGSFKWAALIIIAVVAGFWTYQNWLATSTNSEPALSGLVFATKIEANGQALDPGTVFSQDITEIYAVFRPGLEPPGMKVNVETPIEGAYYKNLKIIDSSIISSFGWRWYYNGKQVNNFETPVVPKVTYWLGYNDYREKGVFGNDFSPGTYTIVILLGGNPTISSKLVIEPLPVTKE